MLAFGFLSLMFANLSLQIFMPNGLTALNLWISRYSAFSILRTAKDTFQCIRIKSCNYFFMSLGSI